jgi:hypothetical protein
MPATGSATAIGLAELRAAVDRFPAAVTAALRASAWQTSRRVFADAKRRLLAQQKTPAHALADAMQVLEDPAKKQFLVLAQAPAGQPANLPIWIERGTRFMRARPYMRPAADGAQARYKADMTAAATQVATRELG